MQMFFSSVVKKTAQTPFSSGLASDNAFDIVITQILKFKLYSH